MLLNDGPTNGIVFELMYSQKKHNNSWDEFYSWIEPLYQDSIALCALSTFKIYVGSLEREVKNLKGKKKTSHSIYT